MNQPAQDKSLIQQVFETRLSLAEAAFQLNHTEGFQLAINLIANDLDELLEDSDLAKERKDEILTLKDSETLNQFSIQTSKALHQSVAPLMQYIEQKSHSSSYEFDKVIALSQIELLKNSETFKDFKAILVILVDQLPIDLEAIKEKCEIINQIKILNSDFWKSIDVSRLEEIRLPLRDLMQFRIPDKPTD